MSNTSTSNGPAQPRDDPPGPYSFHSVLPVVDELLSIIQAQSTSDTPPSGVEAAGQVTAKALELASLLDDMKRAALSMPGGQYNRTEVEEMIRILEREAESRRDILGRLAASPIPTAEVLKDSHVGQAGE